MKQNGDEGVAALTREELIAYLRRLYEGYPQFADLFDPEWNDKDTETLRKIATSLALKARRLKSHRLKELKGTKS